MNNERLWSVAKHPVLTGVIGVMVGLVAAYGAPTFAKSVMRYVVVADEPSTPANSFQGGGGENGGGNGNQGMKPPMGDFGSGGNGGEGGGQGMRPPMGSGNEGQKFDSRQQFAPGTEPGNGNNNGNDNGNRQGQQPPNQDGQGKKDYPNNSVNAPMPPNDQQGDQMNQEQQKRDEERQAQQEKQQKAGEARMLQDIQRQMKNAQTPLKMFAKTFDKMAKKGIPIPADCKDALDKATTLIGSMGSISTVEQAQDFDSSDLQDYFETLQECQQTLQRMSRVPAILKRADRDIKNLDRQWQRARKGAPDAAADAVADGETAMLAIKQARTKLDELFKAGEVDDIEAVMEDDIYGKFDEVGSIIQRIGAAKNAKQFMASYARQLRDAKAVIAKLKSMKEDTTAAEEILVRAQEKYAEVKTLKAGSEEWQTAVDELAQLGQEFVEATGSTQDFSKDFGSPPQQPNTPQAPKL